MKEKRQKRHYLDWAATAPAGFPPTADVSIFGNPSSPHGEGRLAKEALETARSRCAVVLGVPPERLYFTSGGTESNAVVLYSFLRRHFSRARVPDAGKGKARLLYSGVEHPSVRENCITLDKLGISCGEIGVESDGRVSVNTLSKALSKNPEARFAALMGVNNETGSLMDIKSLVSLVRDNEKKTGLSVHFHSDLVQAVGKVPVDISGWDIDSASFSCHKLGGPRGIGLLYLKKPIEVLCTGGGQERGIRSGTENIQGAIALAGILESRAKNETVQEEENKARERFKYLINGLKKISRCAIIPEEREEDDARFSPWILQARFHGVPGAVMVRALDDSGVAVSTGSACSSSSPERPVLAAMGISEIARLEGIRISQGWSTEKEDLDALLFGIEKALAFL